MTDATTTPDSSDAAEIFEAIFTPAGRADPYQLYAALHELGDVVVLEPGEPVRRGGVALRGFDRLPIAVA